MINPAAIPDWPYTPPADRLRGYHAALADAGIAADPELVVELPWNTTMGADGMDRLLSLQRPPTAVFAFSDEVAAGALRSLRRAGIAVPGAMSVIGIDDHPLAELCDLTTVRQPVELQGIRSARLALEMLNAGPVGERHIVVPTHLVIRGTTGAVGGA
jgi:DNA-binding LacI/PurR family transcriptional regulator